MANPRSQCTRAPSPGTPISHETTGIETFAIDTSGGDEDDQPGIEVSFRAPRFRTVGKFLRPKALVHPKTRTVAIANLPT